MCSFHSKRRGSAGYRKLFYWNQADAAEHLQMFSDMDDADLKEMYSRIQMLVIDGQTSMVLQEIKY